MDVPTQIGLKMDSKGDEVGRLQSYLKRFGYIRPDEERPYGLEVDVKRAVEQPKPMVFEKTTEQALIKFQKFNRLPATGVLDKATINLMLKPRCGLPDFVVPEGSVVDYVDSGRKWTKLDLTYTFENYTPDLTQSQVESAIGAGLLQWSLVTPLNFSEAASGGDIKFRWGSGNHGCGYPFDGPSGVLAHAFYPEDGRVHFDEDELWTKDAPPTGIDLASVAVHELGHALGLAHSNDTNAVMYAYYSGIRRTLTQDDIDGIQHIYGKPTWKCPIAKSVSTTTIPAIIASTQFLRQFREDVVLKSMFKTPFKRILDLYYELTPIINKQMDSSAMFRQLVKCVAYPFIFATKGAASLALASMKKSNHYRLRMGN